MRAVWGSSQVMLAFLVSFQSCGKSGKTERPSPSGPVPGQRAPEIEGEDLHGELMKLSDFRGQVVVLHFWGHW